jgi:dienelactone hydrolase
MEQVSDHPVIIPTSRGGVSAIVSRPVARQRGAFALLQGAGPPCRAGINAVWTRAARELAALGLAVIRFDFACEGDSTPIGQDVPRIRAWRRSIDLSIMREITPWFLERCGEEALSVAGSCHGARVALEFAATESVTNGAFLLVPYMRDREPHMRTLPEDEVPPLLDELEWATGPTLNSEGEITHGLRAALSRGPVWVLVGEDEAEEVRPFQRFLMDAERPLELEVLPGMAELHPVGTLSQQETALRRLVDRVRRSLAEREEMSRSA